MFRAAVRALAIGFRAGWRPAAGWTCCLILLANGVILPVCRLRGFNFEPIDWRALAVFVGALVTLAGLRSFEKHTGSEDNDANG
jgi:hypothetical protein